VEIGPMRRRSPAFLLSLAVAAAAIALGGCGGVATNPVTVDAFLDATYSNKDVSDKCLADLHRAALTAAESRGLFFFHTFDGDPLRRRGTSADFGDLEVPNRFKGTGKELEGLEAAAVDAVDETLWPEVEAMASEPPKVGTTPLVGVLTRAVRIQEEGQVVGPHRVLICTDGLFTDVTPRSSPEEVSELGSSLEGKLAGATVDFIGLAVSVPGTGTYVDKGRPQVQQLLEEAGATMGIWDVELPAGWEPVPRPVEGDK
jgi:hypothetical protein